MFIYTLLNITGCKVIIFSSLNNNIHDFKLLFPSLLINKTVIVLLLADCFNENVLNSMLAV